MRFEGIGIPTSIQGVGKHYIDPVGRHYIGSVGHKAWS